MERRSLGESIGNRPDCAYFLLLGLSGAAFLLTIGGILTYVAFNPGSIDGHPHSALSHIPHFHRHSHHPNNQHPQIYHHPINEGHHNPPIQHHSNNHTHTQTLQTNKTLSSNISAEADLTTKPNNSSASPTKTTHDDATFTHIPTRVVTPPHHHELHSPFHHTPNSTVQSEYEAKAKQSLVLAIIGPLCLLMGIVVTLIVGVLALKHDCDQEPEPNISFLRLRSEISLNFDPDKNNYELLRPSSSIEQAGGHFSINPTGLPESS